MISIKVEIVDPMTLPACDFCVRRRTGPCFENCETNKNITFSCPVCGEKNTAKRHYMFHYCSKCKANFDTLDKFLVYSTERGFIQRVLYHQKGKTN